MGVGKLRARPTTLVAAHVSGKRIGVVAPARERAAPIARTKTGTGESKVARATRARETRVAGSTPRAKSSGARMARETGSRRRAASHQARAAVHGRSSRAAVRGVHRSVRPATTTSRIRRRGTRSPNVGRASRSLAARREAIHRMTAHREAARSAAARRVSRRVEHMPGASAHRPPVYGREVRHERASLPPRENHAAMRSAEAPRAAAPSAAMHGNPLGAPPGHAARPHAQGEPQPAAPAAKGKEKKERG